MPKPPDGFFLNLPYPLPGKPEPFTDLFEGERQLPVDSEIEADDFGFARGEGGKGLLDFTLECIVEEGFVGVELIRIVEDIEQAVVFTFVERRVERKVSTRDFECVRDLVVGHVEFIGDLTRAGLATEFLLETARGFPDLVEGPHSIEW